MFSSHKLAVFVVLIMIAPVVLAACATPEPEVIEKVVTEIVEVVVTEIVEVAGTPEVVERIVEVEVTVPPQPPEEEAEEAAPGDGEPGPYRIALFEDPITLNYWSYMGPDRSVWTAYVVGDQAPALFGLSDVTFQWVPYLAAEVPEPVDNGDGTWTITVPMVQNAMWSDGEPITAHDFVFTFNACKDLKLTHNWPGQCKPNDLDAVAEAVDDYTVQLTLLNQPPSLGNWQNGVALAPILPEHYWADAAADAYAFIDGLEAPTVEMPEGVDCAGAELSDVDAAACKSWAEAWDPYNEAYVNARRTLYEDDASGAPSGGPYLTDKLELGAFAQRVANMDWAQAGAEIVEYDDGTWMKTLADGTTYQLYGDAAGDETLRFTEGPYAPNVIISIYGSQDAAFLALADGEVDYVLNPLGLAKGLQELAEKGEGVESYTNADYGMYYLAFNMRKYPMSEPEFRQAIEIVLDKEFVVEKVLGGVVFPMYAAMPPGNAYWYNPDVPTPYTGWTREERVNEAVRVLEEAGWTWAQKPQWSEDMQDVVPGEGITMPNGEPMQEITILGPGPAYDPLRATFNQWISEWARELGMPITSELTGLNTMIGPVFVDASFDMYIQGWSLGNVAFPTYFEIFWHSRNDTAVTGNSNTPGYNNPEYDALIDEFMSTGDLERAQELIFEAQIMLAEDLPYVPLFYKQTIDLARDTLIFPYTEALGGLEFVAGLQSATVPVAR